MLLKNRMRDSIGKYLTMIKKQHSDVLNILEFFWLIVFAKKTKSCDKFFVFINFLSRRKLTSGL